MQAEKDKPKSCDIQYEEWHSNPGPAFFASHRDFFVTRSSGHPLDQLAESLRRWRSVVHHAFLRFVTLPDRYHRSPWPDDDRSQLAFCLQLQDLIWGADSVFDKLIESHNGYSGLGIPFIRFEYAGDFIPCPSDASELIKSLEEEVSESTTDDAFTYIRTGTFSPTIAYLSCPCPITLSGFAFDEPGPSCYVEELSTSRYEFLGPIRSAVPTEDGKSLAEEIRKSSGCSEDSLTKTIHESEFTGDYDEYIWGPIYDAAVGAQLVYRWESPEFIRTYRWRFSWFDEINFLREVFLAGLRVWIEAVLKADIVCTECEDWHRLAALCESVLDAAETAFVREAPSALLGEDELELLRAAYPLLFFSPAVRDCDDETIRAWWKPESIEEWEAVQDGKGVSYDDWMVNHGPESFRLYAAQSIAHPLWNQTLTNLRTKPTRTLTTATESGRVSRALVLKVAKEAERFGVSLRRDNEPIVIDTARRLINGMIEESLAMTSIGHRPEVVPTAARDDSRPYSKSEATVPIDQGNAESVESRCFDYVSQKVEGFKGKKTPIGEYLCHASMAIESVGIDALKTTQYDKAQLIAKEKHPDGKGHSVPVLKAVIDFLRNEYRQNR